jgi:DNA-directed RNA polymerase specialized sigma24 family protein
VAQGPEGYREFVVSRIDQFRRTAYLLSGDWHTADDLVSGALVRLLRHWRRVSRMEDPDAYVRLTVAQLIAIADALRLDR